MSVWSGLRAKLLVGALAAALSAGAVVSSASAAPAPQVSKSRTIAPAAPVAPAADASLKSLKITSPKKVAIKPKFKSKVRKYTAIVPFGTKKVVFKAVPTQAKATVAIKAPKKYKVGTNKVLITVTSTNKKVKLVYTVLIKIFSKDSALTALTAATTPSTPLTLDQAFSPKVLSYTATAPVGTKTISFNALPRAKGSKVVVDAPVVFAEGPNTVKITVTAPDKKTKTVYTIVVNVIPAWTIDPSLASLVVTNPARVSLSPNFTPDTTAYNVRVPVGTTSVVFSPSAAQAAKGATFDIKAPATYALGDNTVTVTVTAPDKKTVRVYTLTVNVPQARNNDPSLASFSVESPAGVGFTPAFDPEVLAYTATAPVGTTSVRFLEVTTQPSATITVSAPASYDSAKSTVTLPVSPGDNTLTLTTKAPDGITTRVYTVTIKVLRAATVRPDVASVLKIVGGFQVNVLVQNATLTATATLGSEPSCSTSTASVVVGAPNASSVASVAVTGVYKGCTITLAFDATPSLGYAVAPIAPISAVSDSDVVGFTASAPVATGDGFTVNWAVTNGSIDTCQMSADSPGIALLDSFDDNGATVSGLLTSMSATVECTFTPAPLMFNIGTRSVTGTSLRPSKMTVGRPAATADGFLFSVSATGCNITTTVTSGKSKVTNPTRGLYTVTVSGLKAAAQATVTVTCLGAAGFAGLPDAPVAVKGAAAASTELPVTVVPRIADASDLDPSSPPASDADLPGLTAGVQPQLLYITSPVWDSADAVNTTYTWQVSDADRDSDGVECSDPNYGIGSDADKNLWTDFDDRAKAALDKSVPQLLRIGILATKRPDYVGRCFRVQVKGTSGSRSTALTTAAVPLSSTEPPAICRVRPSFIGASGMDADTNEMFAERGNVLVATNGVCVGSLGLAVSYRWQFTTATEPGLSTALWEDLNNTTSRLVVGGANLGTSIRVVIRYKADNGTFDIASDPLPVSGSVTAPVNSATPTVANTAGEASGTGSSKAKMNVNIGTWQSAGGAKLKIRWQQFDTSIGDWGSDISDKDGVIVSGKSYTAKSPGRYRVSVSFSSYVEGLYDEVIVYSNEYVWSGLV
ncbi:MAG: cadherin-like beta sandwich domain-containing protein [Actinomycetales bacterium]|nr:cadherin-like beta sandwich domain-containing protein [Actinomycetales bacterium]